MVGSARVGSAVAPGAPAQTSALDGLDVRLASPADDDGLVALAGRCPMQADVSLLIERAPSFFALARARGDGFTLVAETGDGVGERRIAGCLSVARRRAWVNGRRETVAFAADLRVAPERRGQGLSQLLLDAAAACETRDQARLPPLAYVGATATGNAAVDGVVRRFGAGRPLVPVARMIGWQLLPALNLRLRVPRGVEIGRAEERDRAELATLLDGFGQLRALAPVFADGGLDDQLARSPGMALADHLVARRQGRLVAALGAWDAKTVKQTRVLGMPGPLRAFVGFCRVAGRALPLPRLPAVGERLAARYLRHVAHAPGEEAALSSLLRLAVNEARARRDHFALLACAHDDPLQRCLAGIPRLRYHYQLVAGALRPGGDPARALGPGPFHDDAALA